MEAMEDSSQRTNHSNLLQVQKEEIIATCSIDHKLENVEMSTTSDVGMLLNDNSVRTRTAIPPPTQLIHSVRQNEIEASLIDNKENVIRNETTSLIGESHVAPNPFLPHQPLDQIDCNQYEVDPSTTSLCPPLMAYTNSLALSDISMPFPSLETSKSFGPSGILHSNSNNDATTTQSHSRRGRKVYNLSHSQMHTPDNSYKVDMQYEQNFHEDGTALNDLNIAARALLDLTPAVAQNYQLDHAPEPINHHHHHHMNQIILSGTVQSDNRAKKVPMMRQKHSVSINFDSRATHQNLPSRAHIESRAKDLLNEVPYTVQACKCKNTQCLKLYCTCFQQGTLCDELVCLCRKCENTAKHSKPRGSRTRAIYEILNRRIDAFDPRERKQTGHGCSCRKSK